MKNLLLLHVHSTQWYMYTHDTDNPEDPPTPSQKIIAPNWLLFDLYTSSKDVSEI